jgi:hypothetical protein
MIFVYQPREHVAWIEALDKLTNYKNEPWRRENQHPRKKKKKCLAKSH